MSGPIGSMGAVEVEADGQNQRQQIDRQAEKWGQSGDLDGRTTAETKRAGGQVRAEAR